MSNVVVVVQLVERPLLQPEFGSYNPAITMLIEDKIKQNPEINKLKIARFFKIKIKIICVCFTGVASTQLFLVSLSIYADCTTLTDTLVTL